MKKFLFLFVLFSVNASAQISSDRSISWSSVGATIPARSTICSTITSGASISTVNAAIAACGAGEIVRISAGTYNFNSGMVIARSDITVKCDAPDSTFINFTGGNACMGLWANVCIKNASGTPHVDSPGTVANWTAGFTKGTTTITLSTVAGLSVNNLLVLDQLDDTNTDTGNIWVCDVFNICASEGGAAGRSGRAQMQFVRVTAINGNDVTFTPGLYMPNWRIGQTPQAWWIDPAVNVGIEGCSFNHVNSGFFQAGIFVGNAYNSWIKNIRSLNSNRNHIWMYEVGKITIRDSYFYGTLNSMSQSYGVETRMASESLIENNIFEHITTPMMNGNANGVVFAYNYALDDFYSVASWQQASSYFHSAGVDHILWESNDGIGFTADNIHGTSHFGTAFRNYWNGRDPGKTQQTSPFILMATNRYLNLIGNVIGTPGYHTNYECAPVNSSTATCSGLGNVSIYTIGWSGNGGTKASALPNDTLVKDTMMRWGNYDTVTGTSRFVSGEVPTGISPYPNSLPSSTLLPNSMYLTSIPVWYTTRWPSIGPDVNDGDVSGLANHVYKIPARRCYEQTSKTGGILNFNADYCYTGTGGISDDGQFTIPNNDVVFNPNQSIWFSTDIAALVQGIKGEGVISGAAVAAQGSPDMTVAVAAGIAQIGGNAVTVSSGNLTISAADAASPRFDIISVNNAGTKAVTTGTPATPPVVPTIPANSVLLATVYVAANQTSISSNKITDKRVFVQQINALVGVGPIPAISNTTANSCGTTAATIGTGSKNTAGFFTVGATGGTSCTLTFTIAAPTGWVCTASNETTVANDVRWTRLSTTTGKFTGTFVAGDVINYFCTAY